MQLRSQDDNLDSLHTLTMTACQRWSSICPHCIAPHWTWLRCNGDRSASKFVYRHLVQQHMRLSFSMIEIHVSHQLGLLDVYILHRCSLLLTTTDDIKDNYDYHFCFISTAHLVRTHVPPDQSIAHGVRGARIRIMQGFPSPEYPLRRMFLYSYVSRRWLKDFANKLHPSRKEMSPMAQTFGALVWRSSGSSQTGMDVQQTGSCLSFSY
jgi:hypothetical protein